jgi:alkylation response protein AidB-like acyl-CoA dehydrogenase
MMPLLSPAESDRLRSFLTDQINPQTQRRDQEGESFPKALLSELSTMGLLGYSLPVSIGGRGEDILRWGLLLEDLGYLCEDGSLPLLLSLRVAVVKAIYEGGNAAQIDRYIPAMVRGELAGAFAYSDGTDPFNFRSGVSHDGDKLCLRGEKLLITGGTTADIFLTYLKDRTSGDLLVILVHKDDPGVSLSPVAVTGFRSAGLATLRINDVILGKERLLTQVDGLSHAQRFLNQRRPLLVCGALGRMRAIRDRCVRELLQTERYGQPLTEMQNVQATIGRMTIRIESARALLLRTLTRMRDGESDALFDPLPSAAKHHVTEQALEVVLCAMRLLGGQGYLKDSALERYLRDFTGLIPGAGAQDILEVNLGVGAISEVERALREEERRRKAAI